MGVDIVQDQTADNGVETTFMEWQVSYVGCLQLHSVRNAFQFGIAAGDLDTVA